MSQLPQRRIDHERLTSVIALVIDTGRFANQTLIANKAGITPQALSNVCAGRRAGKPDLAHRLSHALGVPIRLITTTEPLPQEIAKIKQDEAKAVARKRAAKKAVAA